MHCIEYYLPADVPILTTTVTASDVLYRGRDSLKYMANVNYSAFVGDLFDKGSAPNIFHDKRQPVVEISPDVDYRAHPPVVTGGDEQHAAMTSDAADQVKTRPPSCANNVMSAGAAVRSKRPRQTARKSCWQGDTYAQRHTAPVAQGIMFDHAWGWRERNNCRRQYIKEHPEASFDDLILE